MKDIQEKQLFQPSGWAIVFLDLLLVALVSEVETQPIINTGTLSS